ncbi:MAG: VWA domain-containing protein [Chloroflexi bacterium]|nr:VWA domain-containing protein [Chloroflexota bacterium]
MNVYRYSRWDGTQEFLFNAEEVMDALADDLTTHGDLWRALQRLFQRGMTGRHGGQIQGLQQFLERLRSLRQRDLEKHNLSSIMDDLSQRLDRVIETERAGIQNRLTEASSDQPELKKLLEQIAQKKLDFLDNLPQDMGGAIKALTDYDFMDGDARQQFQDLLDMLQRAVMDSYFNQLQQGLQSLTPQDLARTKEMVEALNQLLREKMAGMEPDFQSFMNQYGDLFGDQPPQSLEELIEGMQRQIAQMRSLIDSLPQEHQQALQELLNAALQDEGLRRELAELASNLNYLNPRSGQRNQYSFWGDEPISLQEAMELMKRLQAMDDLERQIRKAQQGGSLDNIEGDKLAEVLGDDAQQTLEQLKRTTELLEEAGYIKKEGNRFQLTPRGIRKIGQKALRDIFTIIRKGRPGKHITALRGQGGDQAEETKIYEFGDNFYLHLEKTITNALYRHGSGTPIPLKPEDFEVFRAENLTQCSTVLMLDLSLSMPMRGNFFAAKKVAMALENLIRTQFPRDNFYIIGFAGYARQIKPEELPHVGWNEYVPGTNMHHGFMLSRQLLARHKGGTRQIILITDGEPTAHLEEGRARFAYPPTLKTVQETLKEVKRCTRERIVINTFMLERNHYLKDFVGQLTKINRGRAFYTTAETLGQYILVDYVANKTKRLAS